MSHQDCPTPYSCPILCAVQLSRVWSIGKSLWANWRIRCKFNGPISESMGQCWIAVPTRYSDNIHFTEHGVLCNYLLSFAGNFADNSLIMQDIFCLDWMQSDHTVSERANHQLHQMCVGCKVYPGRSMYVTSTPVWRWRREKGGETESGWGGNKRERWGGTWEGMRQRLHGAKNRADCAGWLRMNQWKNRWFPFDFTAHFRFGSFGISDDDR